MNRFVYGEQILWTVAKNCLTEIQTIKILANELIYIYICVNERMPKRYWELLGRSACQLSRYVPMNRPIYGSSLWELLELFIYSKSWVTSNTAYPYKCHRSVLCTLNRFWYQWEGLGGRQYGLSGNESRHSVMCTVLECLHSHSQEVLFVALLNDAAPSSSLRGHG